MPQELSSAEVKKADCTIKVLGAFIGEESKVSEELVKSLQKHYEIFRRLKQMGINNTSAQLLSKCVNVRQNYQLRVHHPIVSENLAKLFDHEVEEALNSWFGTLSQDQITQLRLPVKKGGLGLTACLPIRCAAFESSWYSVFERPINLSAQVEHQGDQTHAILQSDTDTSVPTATTDTSVPIDEDTAAAALHTKAWDLLSSSKSDSVAILQAVSYRGNAEWVMSNAKFVPSRLFSLALMPRLGIAHPLLPKQLLCPGCRILLDSKAMLAHIPGCSKCPGLNATAKHNSLVNFLYELCLKAGIPCEKEPRNFATFSCTQCNEKVDPDYRRTHGKVCGGRSFRRSGPDLVVFWNSGEIFYDFTVIHELAPSNLGTKCGKLFRDAIKRKQDTYVRSGLISEETFRCVPVLSGGSLHENTKSLLNALADACCLPRKQTQMEFQLCLQELNGAVVYSQLRSFLEKDKRGTDYAI